MAKVISSFLVMLFVTQISYCQINAEFISSDLSACDALQTTFFDQSTSDVSIIDWSWNINGNTSSKQNPGALFTEFGSFTICLTVTDVNGNSDTECKEDYVTVYPNPVPDFTIDNNEGCIPVLVNFSDNSTSQNGNIVSWLWDIGGSAGVISQTVATDFSSSYNIQGSYTNSLTIIDERGCTATISEPNAVIASALITPDIKVDLVPTCDLPWSVNFLNQNADPLISYIWDFGNGETYNGLQPPTIIYSEVGTYDITIYMESGDCLDTITLNSFIDTKSTAAIDYSPSVVCQNSPVQYTDISISEADAVLWMFGDGTTSTEENPMHSYSSPGCFDVLLIRTVGVCIDTAIISCVNVLELPDVTYDITNQYACSLPTEILLHAESSASGDISWQFIKDGIITDYNTNDVSIEIKEFGTYYAVLNFIAQSGCRTVIDSIPIGIEPFEANMPVETIGGCAPLTFTLIDSITSNIDIASYQWSIGNPEVYSSQLSTPTFTIPDTGKYDLQLIAENINGCIDTVYIKDYIQVGNKPIVDFVASPLVGCVDIDKVFTNLSSGNANSWLWTFGEDSYSDIQNPIISFEEPGSFNVALLVGHNGCFDSLTFENYITIFEPSADYDIIYNCEDPYTVTIENTSVGADSLFWTLQPSETETLVFTDSIFGSYTFSGRGEYPISLYTKSFDSGCDNTEEDTIRIVDPIASYTVDTLRGCAPFSLEIGNFSQDAFEYEFVSDIANIDSIFKDEPIVTFNEGGILQGPLLIITDIHECRDSFQLLDSVQVNKLEAVIDYSEVICVPDVAELIDQSTTVLSNITSWEWKVDPVDYISNDQNTSLLIDSVGSYDLSFSVMDDWGCKDSVFIQQAITAIEINPDFTFDSLGCSWAPINFEAFGQNNNEVEYLWEFGDGNTSNLQNPSYTYSGEGNYNVCLTMTAIQGCAKTICQDNVVTISDPVAQYLGDPISATCPPLLSNFENQSTNALTYIWDFGDNSGQTQAVSPSHVYTSPGRYDVTLIATATPGCSDTLFLPEYIKVEGPKGEFEADIAPTCLPVAVTLSATSDDFYTYVWDLGNGVLDSVSGLVIEDVISYEYTQPGRFTPKLIITDSVGCTNSFAGPPIELDLVNLDFSLETDTICGPPLAVLLQNQSFGTTDEVAYQWQITGVDTFTSNDKDPAFDIEQTGDYNVSLIAEYGNCLDTLSIADFMEVADIPLVIFEIQTEELCEDVNVTFLNNSTIDYGEFETWLWDFGDGNTSDEKNPTHQYEGLDGKTITLTGITDKGCEATYSSSFEVLPSTIATVEEDKTICIGDQIQILGSIENLQTEGSFFWEEDESLSCTDCLSPVVMPLTTTSYILVAIHPNGCESRDTIEVVVIQSPGPELELQTDSIVCVGIETQITVINFDPSLTYQWDTTVPGQDCYSNCEVIHISLNEPATYFVSVANEFGCFKNDSITIDVESSIEDFLLEENAICLGEETTISISGGNNPQWAIDPEIECTSCAENTISPDQTSTYTVSVESDLGCIYEDSISVIVVPANSANLGETEEICVGESISLTAEGIGNFLWTSNLPLTIDNEPTITVTPDQTEYFYLNMSFFECSQMDSILVIVHEKADIEATGDTICSGDVAVISATGMADKFEWQINGDFENAQNIDVTPELTTQYQIIASFRTCDSDTAVATVLVYPMIDYSIEEDFYNIFLNDQVHILPEYDQERNYSFDWLPSTGLSCSDCPDPIISNLIETVDYNVLIIDEDTGCESEQEITVRFNNECNNSIFHLPNIFSPNNDGSNDEWRMYTNNPEEFVSLSVFDRYGNFLFFTNEITQSWNGKHNELDVVTGVYVYRLNLICPYDKKEYSILGDVTVIR